MLLFLVQFVVLVKISTSQSSTGTILFYNKHIDTDCWSQEELAKLQARKILNQLIPKQTPPDQISKKFANDALRYYREALYTVDKQHHSSSQKVLREALADTIGGHLRSEVLPAVRLAFYAGYVPYKPAKELHDLYSQIKTSLNTEGRGWKPPPKIPLIANLTVTKLAIGRGKLFDPCNFLVVKRDSNACIRMPIPIVDDANDPSAIALPFKSGGLVNMLSPTSENIFLKYYTTASRCILRRSPTTCRHSDIVKFNSDLWCWMKNDVAPHLMDEKLYAAYGGVLRVAAAVQNYGKVLPRRNLFDNYRNPIVEWDSWRKLTEPYFFIDSDWTPSIYVGVVVLAAFAICLLQMFYNYIFGQTNTCACGGEKPSVFQKIKQQHIQHGATKSVYYNEPQRTCCSPGSRETNKSSQIPSKTQRVYDYNDNLLDVIMSDAEAGEYSSSDSNNGCKKENQHYEIETKAVARTTSPPKIETSIEQLKINRGRVSIRGDGAQMMDKWASTEDGSSSCCESASSGSSTSRPRTRQARQRSRDLAWARQVLHSEISPAPHTRTSRTSPHTEMDSYTTSTTQR
ncbi:uncharacterized protein LOC133527936 [Cydia pomonella]|uniref:uncharacterized protein LOC133527936 n=1 Tax=Cydia pomonella TaxID=82600 RepID=UPI002ADDFFD8|nr:uncharacterized protein LOC133527936 [Cydia pomonella]